MKYINFSCIKGQVKYYQQMCTEFSFKDMVCLCWSRFLTFFTHTPGGGVYTILEHKDANNTL